MASDQCKEYWPAVIPLVRRRGPVEDDSRDKTSPMPFQVAEPQRQLVCPPSELAARYDLVHLRPYGQKLNRLVYVNIARDDQPELHHNPVDDYEQYGARDPPPPSCDQTLPLLTFGSSGEPLFSSKSSTLLSAW